MPFDGSPALAVDIQDWISDLLITPAAVSFALSFENVAFEGTLKLDKGAEITKTKVNRVAEVKCRYFLNQASDGNSDRGNIKCSASEM